MAKQNKLPDVTKPLSTPTKGDKKPAKSKLRQSRSTRKDIQKKF